MKRNPLYWLSYAVQRYVRCPMSQGSHDAHMIHLRAQNAVQLEELRKVHGPTVKEIPGMPGHFFIPEPVPGAGQPQKADLKVVDFTQPRPL